MVLWSILYFSCIVVVHICDKCNNFIALNLIILNIILLGICDVLLVL